MFQAQIKLEFIRRYCSPTDGWTVFVDIDASEEGRTGGEPTKPESCKRRMQMQADAKLAIKELKTLNVTVGGKRAAWHKTHGLPLLHGDRDIVAFHPKQQRYLIAEVEGESSGQPGQKVYKAIGQLVIAASGDLLTGWKRQLVLVVHGEKLRQYAGRAKALEKLEFSAIAISETENSDIWLFGETLSRIRK